MNERTIVNKSISNIEEEIMELFLESDFILFKWRNDIAWPVEFVSDNVKNVFGHSSADFMSGSLNYANLIHPDDIERVTKEVKDGSKFQKFIHEPYRILCSDGRYIWIYDATHVIRDEDGSIIHYVGYITEITSIVKKERELQRLKERFELATLATSDGVWDWDVLNDKVWFSERFKSMLGYADDEMGSELSEWEDKIHPDDVPKVWADVELHFQGKTEFYENTHRLKHKNGKWLWILDRGKALFDDAGKPYRMLGFHTDITQKREVEDKLKLYSKIYENSKEGISITDANSHIISVNDSFTKITGYSREEVIGKTSAVLSSGRHNAEFYANLWKELINKGSWQGEIFNKNKSGEIYPEWISIFAIKDRDSKIINYAATFSNITPLKDALQKSDYLSHYDTLTNLPNPHLFYDRVNQALLNSARNSKKVALLYLDLDHFKNINDSLGHNVGNRVLFEVASRLTSCIRKNDTVSRRGGDEFLILLSDITTEYDIIKIVEKIHEEMTEVITVENHRLISSFSIGIAISPENGTDFETLLKHADTAMFQAKNSGRNTFRFFKPEMNTIAERKHTMHIALNQALEKNEFTLHYQPQYDINSKRIFAAEALLRWSSSELGNVSPEEFIPLAEETGLILPIGEWVLHEACAQAKAWSLDKDMPELTIAVNISVLQFKQSDFERTILHILQTHKLDTKYLELELTESLLIQDMEQNMKLLNSLKARGIEFSIDDFGTGYSSLSYLKEIPANRLKIDQSFIKNVRHNKDDEAIVRSVISLGKHFGMQVIAEGVETIEDLDFLATMECHEIQGYYISRPLSAESFEELIKKEN